MPRYLMNIILLLFVLALMAFVWFKPFKEAQPSTISDLNISEITRIEIIRPANSDLAPTNQSQATPSESNMVDKVILERDNNQWQMTAPLTTQVNQARIRHLMTLLNEEVVFSTPAKQQS
ncbi:MAG TPA: hypothetical protein ENK78_07640, partial [Thiothrix sp.]|nr:hypothetical protein [Thiothrix sp.]